MHKFEEYYPESEEEWLELRSTVLTATDISVILGLNKFSSVAQMQDKKNNIVPIDNSYMYIGRVLEDDVVTFVNNIIKSSGNIDSNYTLKGMKFYANTTLGLGATPDAYGEESLLECKTTKNYYIMQAFPPAYYLSQLYIQLYCTNMSWGRLAIASTNFTQKNAELNLRLSIHKLLRNDELDAIIIKEIERYWKTTNESKQFKVDRRLSKWIEMKLRWLTKKEY